MADFDLDDIERRMDGAVTALKTEFAGLRTGRASASLLEPIHVDAYGSMMPLNQASMATVTREESGDAAGIYNMARNLGGSVGLAVIGTFIDRRNSLHIDRLGETLNANATLVQERLAGSTASHFAQVGDFAHAQLQAMKEIVLTIHQQASVMTFSETFYVLAAALLLCVPLALTLKTPQQPGKAPASNDAH